MNKAASTSMDESEFALMNEIARSPTATQRELSASIGLSLGMTNLLLKRLARKGLIKVRQLDWKRTQYLLTPKGAVEKTQKVLDYARYTVRLFRQLQENFGTVLRREHAAGRRRFCIVAQDELGSALREAAAGLDLPGLRIDFAAGFSGVPAGTDLVLSATQEPAPAALEGRVAALVDFLDVSSRH